MKKLKLSDTSLLRWFEESSYFPRMARVRFVHLRQFRLKVRLLLQEYARRWVRIRGHLRLKPLVLPRVESDKGVLVADALTFFKQVYGEVPEWVRTMHEHKPEALNDYLTLRRTVMDKGTLSRKEKEWILVGVNAARRYERSMLYHTRGALDAGSTVSELSEILLPCILSRGIPAWLEGYKALVYAEQYLGRRDHDQASSEETTEATAPSITTVEEALAYFSGEAGGNQPEWVSFMIAYAPRTLRDYANLRKLALSDGHVPGKMKELVLVGINLSERYPSGVSLHVTGARRLGATDTELADVALTCVLTAGIPAWFELSNLLTADQEGV